MGPGRALHRPVTAVTSPSPPHPCERGVSLLRDIWGSSGEGPGLALVMQQWALPPTCKSAPGPPSFPGRSRGRVPQASSPPCRKGPTHLCVKARRGNLLGFASCTWSLLHVLLSLFFPTSLQQCESILSSQARHKRSKAEFGHWAVVHPPLVHRDIDVHVGTNFSTSPSHRLLLNLHNPAQMPPPV